MRMSKRKTETVDEAEKPQFRIARAHNYLTYAQTTKGMTPEKLLEHLTGIVGVVQEYLISQERHKDLGYHLHAYIKHPRFESENVKIFDWTRYGKVYHPNIKAVKGDKYRLFRYIKKDGDYITNFDSRPEWKRLVEDSDSEIEFYENILYSIGGRITSFMGSKALFKLWDCKSSLPEEAPKIDKVSINEYMRRKGLNHKYDVEHHDDVTLEKILKRLNQEGKKK